MLIEQTRNQPKETLDTKLNRQMEAFSFSPLINLVEEGKWLLAVTSFEPMNCFYYNLKKNRFSITTPGHWSLRGGAETINVLREILGLRAQNNVELHAEVARKRGNQIKIGDTEYKLRDLDTP